MSAPDPPVPARLGAYDILSKIAEGGMGTVYRARHRATGAIVAVKVIAPATARNSELLKRFEREFVAAAVLHHPNVVRAIDYSGAMPYPFLVMEFVDGPSIGQRIEQRGAFPEAEAVRLIAQVCDGLHSAHRRGLVHRDVRPDNILVTRDGVAKLADFGIVKELEGDLNLTRTGRGMGAPRFMPPEQFRNAKSVDVRGDVYALGATLYAMVTGVTPFGDASPLDCWMRKVRNAFPSPQELNPAVSDRVDWAIRRAMSAEPAQRPANCREFLEDLTGEDRAAPAPASAPRFDSDAAELPPDAGAEDSAADFGAAPVRTADASAILADRTSAELLIEPSSVRAEAPGADHDPAGDPGKAEITCASIDLPPPPDPDDPRHTVASFALPPPPVNDDSGVIDWGSADEAPRGAPPDAALSGVLSESADEGSGDPSVTLDWMADSAGEAPTPPPVRAKPVKSAPRREWSKPSLDPPERVAKMSRGGRVRVIRVKKVRPITDQVHFSLTAPAAMRAGQRYALNVWAHLAAQLAEVIVRAERAGGPVQVHTKGGVGVARGTRLTVQLRIPAFPIAAPDDTDVIEWNGEIGNATFPVHVPPDAQPGGYDGTALIYAAGVQIAKLHFVLQVALAAAAVGPVAAREVRHKRAFASYASQDRKAVLARIQGIQKVAPDLEIFVDVASLRSGERWADRLEREVTGRDVFYLFWSAGASTSEWVEREWRAALQARGLDYIDPVPLVDPTVVPPPPELAGALHFNDWVLAYLRGADAEPEAIVEYRLSCFLIVTVLVLAIGMAAGMYFSGVLEPPAK